MEDEKDDEDDDHMIEDTTDEEDDHIEEDKNDTESYTEKEKERIGEELPSKCPVCQKRKNNLLLHIKLKESCNKEVSPDLYQRWKDLASKRNRSKAQKKYIETGKHKNVQKKYMKKCDAADRVLSLQVQSRKQARYIQREKIKRGKQSSSKRLKSFHTMCIDILQALKQGIIPNETQLNRFHLVEPEIDPKDMKLYTWMKAIDKPFFLDVIMFQQMVFMTKTEWESSLKSAGNLVIEAKIKIRKIIGKMQAYKHQNTSKVYVHEKFQSKCKATEDKSLTLQPRPETFSDCDKNLLAELIQDIMGEGTEELGNSHVTLFLPFKKMLDNLYVIEKMV